MKRRLGWKAVLTVAVIGVASQMSLQAALTEELHKTYPIEADGRVSLSNVHGAVHISGWDRNEVQVDAIKRAETKTDLDEANIVIDSSSGSISIRTKYPDHQYRFFRQPATVEYTLKVPRRARLFAIETVHGPVDIAGVTGEVKASSVHGSVTARNLASEARLSSVHGSLEANFDRLEGSPSISLNTVHGGIVLALPEKADLEYSANTVHGRIMTDMGAYVSRNHKTGGSLNGRTGAGGARVKLNTVHGDIRIVSTIGGRRVLHV